MRPSMVVLLLLLAVVGCSQGPPAPRKLTDEQARAAAESLMAHPEQIPGYRSEGIRIEAWQGVVLTSEYEAKAGATLAALYEGRPYTVLGNFIYHRTPEGKWMLDSMQFSSQDGMSYTFNGSVRVAVP